MKRYKLSRYNLYFSINSNYIAVFNSITQVLSLFIKKWFFFNSAGKIIGLDLSNCKIESLLLEKGFITDEKIDEEELIKVIYEDRYFLLNQEAGLTIILTFQCNFDCCYCYQRESPISSTSKFMNDEVIIKVVKFANSLIQENLPFHLNFFGGEPLLKYGIFPGFIEKVKSFCDKKHSSLFIHVTTNGYNFTERIVNSLLTLCKTMFVSQFR